MTNEYYGYPKEIHQASEIYIKNEIIANQSSLIEDALKLDTPLGGICIDNVLLGTYLFRASHYFRWYDSKNYY